MYSLLFQMFLHEWDIKQSHALSFFIRMLGIISIKIMLCRNYTIQIKSSALLVIQFLTDEEEENYS